MSPTAAPITSGTSTINRTLLHSQQFTSHGVPHPRNGNAAARGLANQSLNGDSPPPQYDVVVHDISLQRHGFFYHFYEFVSPSKISVQEAKFSFPMLRLFRFKCYVEDSVNMFDVTTSTIFRSFTVRQIFLSNSFEFAKHFFSSPKITKKLLLNCSNSDQCFSLTFLMIFHSMCHQTN